MTKIAKFERKVKYEDHLIMNKKCSNFKEFEDCVKKLKEKLE